MPGPFNISVDPLQDYRSASRRIRNGRPNQLLAEGTNLYRHSGLRRLTQSCYRRAQSATVVKMFARDVSIGLRAPLEVEVDRPLCFRPVYERLGSAPTTLGCSELDVGHDHLTRTAPPRATTPRRLSWCESPRLL